MAGGTLVMFFIVCGFITSLRAVTFQDDQMSKAPTDWEITQYFINSQRKHTDTVSEDTDVSIDSETVKFDASGNPNLEVCGTVNLNKIIDELLVTLRKDIKERGKDILTIPDIHETFTKRVGFVKVRGEFDAQKGWVKNMATIHRTADVIASSRGREITLSCGFGLGHLELGYDRYRATFMKFGPHGKINCVIGKNSILLNATVSWANHTCTTTLNDLELNQFGGLNMKVTGLGPLNWLFSRISTWVLHNFKSKIKLKIEDTLKEEIEKQLTHFDCSKYIPKI